MASNLPVLLDDPMIVNFEPYVQVQIDHQSTTLVRFAVALPW